MGDGHGGIDKVASSWTLRGWSPLWTREIVTLHGLKSPSTWMYDSTTYRNHDKNICVSNSVCTLQSLPFTILQLACFTFRYSYTLVVLAWNVLWMFKLVPKLHLNLKNWKTATFLCRGSNHPPLDTSSRSFQLVSEHCSPLLWFKHLWRKMDVSTLGSLRHKVSILDGGSQVTPNQSRRHHSPKGNRWCVDDEILALCASNDSLPNTQLSLIGLD